LTHPPAGNLEPTPLRLCVFSEATLIGGAEIATGYLLAALSDHIEVSIAGTDPEIVTWLASQRRGQPDTVVLPPVRGKADLTAMREHRRAITGLHPDIFQAVLPWMGACRWTLRAVAHVPEVRLVAVEHSLFGPDAFLTRLNVRSVVRKLHAVVVPSAAVAHEVEKVTGIDPDRVHIIHNGVPDVRVEPVPLPGQGPVVGVVARLEPGKRVDLLIRAVAELPGVRLVIVGDGPAGPELRRLVGDLGLSSRVDFAGWTDHARSYAAAFDVVAVPSRSEGFGLVTIEAMLAGTVVVATDVGGAREQLGDSAGLVVPPDDLDALRTALMTVLSDSDRRRSMGERARRRALTEFSPARMARAYEALYADLLRDAA